MNIKYNAPSFVGSYERKKVDAKTKESNITARIDTAPETDQKIADSFVNTLKKAKPLKTEKSPELKIDKYPGGDCEEVCFENNNTLSIKSIKRSENSNSVSRYDLYDFENGAKPVINKVSQLWNSLYGEESPVKYFASGTFIDSIKEILKKEEL